MRQQTQFDLGIIGDDKLPSVLRYKCRADLAAQFGANRNILQIGIGRGKPSCGCSRLVEGGVNPCRFPAGSARAVRRHKSPSVC